MKGWFGLIPLLMLGFACSKHEQSFKMQYWENGNLRLIANYQNGIYHGKVFEWDENGTMYRMGNYENGQEAGLQTLYYPNGKIRARYEVINGRKYGFPGTKNCRNVQDSLH